MQGEIRGAPGVGDCKLALVGGVSSRQVKPERGGKRNGFIAPKKFHQRAAFRLSSSDYKHVGNPAPQDDAANVNCMCASVRAHVLRHAPIRGAVSLK